MRDIRGKTALVSGAASGIGRAIALRLAREGANLFLRRYRRTVAWQKLRPRRGRRRRSRHATMRYVAAAEVSSAVAPMHSTVGMASISWSTTPASRTTAKPSGCRPPTGIGCCRSISVARSVYARAAAVVAGTAGGARAQCVQRSRAGRNAEGHGLLHRRSSGWSDSAKHCAANMAGKVLG